jgi:hypothetical protein
MMPENNHTVATKRPQENRPSEEFEAYCRTELEHRLNSGQDFDEEAFNKAMALALRRLRWLEDENVE